MAQAPVFMSAIAKRRDLPPIYKWVKALGRIRLNILPSHIVLDASWQSKSLRQMLTVQVGIEGNPSMDLADSTIKEKDLFN